MKTCFRRHKQSRWLYVIHADFSGRVRGLQGFVAVTAIAAALLLPANSGRAAIIYWNGSTATANSISGVDAGGIASAVFTDPAANQTGSGSPLIDSNSSSSGYVGASGANNFQARAQEGAFSSSSTYFTVTLTPAKGYLLTLGSVSLGSRSTSTGPTSLAIYSSLDDYMTSIGTVSGLSTAGKWALADITFEGDSLAGLAESAIVLRIYGFGGSGTATSANWRIDDISFTVTSSLAAVPERDEWGIISGIGLLIICVAREWRQRLAHRAGTV